ncbi:MAG: hypothetical protein EPO22_08520, partial [Dehalococcoidia bacterium]
MKRIALALFAITAVVSAGVFATSAYFTDTISENNYTFIAGSADLKFGFCPGISVDCSAVAASLDTYTYDTSQPTGPGTSGSGCVVVQNTGDYALDLTSQVTVASESPVISAPYGMQDAFLVKAEKNVDSSCTPGSGALLYSLQSARSAASFSNLPVGNLAPGAKMYVIVSSAWDSSWDQSTPPYDLQGGNIHLNISMT